MDAEQRQAARERFSDAGLPWDCEETFRDIFDQTFGHSTEQTGEWLVLLPTGFDVDYGPDAQPVQRQAPNEATFTGPDAKRFAELAVDAVNDLPAALDALDAAEATNKAMREAIAANCRICEDDACDGCPFGEWREG